MMSYLPFAVTSKGETAVSRGQLVAAELLREQTARSDRRMTLRDQRRGLVRTAQGSTTMKTSLKKSERRKYKRRLRGGPGSSQRTAGAPRTAGPQILRALIRLT